MKSVISIGVIGLAVIISGWVFIDHSEQDPYVLDLKAAWGVDMPSHYLTSYSEEQIQEGYEMVHLGRVESDGLRKNRYISKYYACTSCHNTVREHDDLSSETPDDRLTRAIRENIPVSYTHLTLPTILLV